MVSLHSHMLDFVSCRLVFMGKEEEHKTEEDSEDSSTSSNDRVENSDLFDIIKKANKGLAGSIRTSKDTTKTLDKQGKSLNKSLHKKKSIRKRVGKDEDLVRNINAEGNIVVIKSSFLDRLRNFFSPQKWHEASVDQSAKREEERAEECSKDEESDELSSEDEIADDLENTGSDEDVDAELEKTLTGLQSLRRSVHFQTQKIKSQRHAAKEMQLLDEDTSKRAKKLEEETKKIK
ncbi:hypothetical protein NEIRO03_1367 [Nematocida sp. AWRm78]|nr:hypothetical protein NEIRO03_1367 [Nematocida sp. AWRm78]